MTSEDFLKIFYSNSPLGIDWANIDEIAWMYQEELIQLDSIVLASHDEFEKRLDKATQSNQMSLREGESLTHLVMKMFATDCLINKLGISKDNILYEYALIGFEVDVIDRDLNFPTECGNTNALKLEKYLSLPHTKKMLILPYPNLEDLKVFQFQATPRFFDYIKHKQEHFNQRNAKLAKFH